MPLATTLVLMAACWFMLVASPLGAQTLKIATIAPEGSAWMQDMRAGAADIRQRTEDRVTLKFYGGGVQGNDRQVQRKMRTGQLHGGAFTSGSMYKFQRDADLYALPMLFNDIDEVRHVRARLDPVLRERLEDAGYVTFGFAGGGFAYMMSNQPLRTLDDLSGQKVWIPEGDEIGFAALRALGIAPVSMPITDVLTGLQTDLLNSVAVPPVGAVVLQWHTRLKYITQLPIAYVYGAILVDRRAFERLAEEDQATVREVLEGIYRRFDEGGVENNEKALEALLESGLELVRPDQGQVPAWREIVMRSHREQARAGVIDAGLLNQLQELLSTYRSRQSAPDRTGRP